MKGESEKEIRISVRAFVEFLCRSGDIDQRLGAGRQREAMTAGARLHRRHQSRMGGDYRAEVALRGRFCLDEEEDRWLLLEGRADGLFQEGELTFVDEIKSMYRDVRRLKEPVLVHRAQVLCYAALWLQERSLSQIGIQLSYYQLETEQSQLFREIWEREELLSWLKELLVSFEKWARLLADRRRARLASTQELEFPFPYRPGQRELVVAAYRSMKREKNLFIQAPTGIGKTMSVMFPAIRAMGEGIGEKLFYLTAKNVTRRVAEESLRLLRARGLHFSSTTLTAREKLCPQVGCECNPESCPMARGHFDRVNEALYELLSEHEAIGRGELLAASQTWQVCPFELSLDASEWTDGILCDYNYVFDPNVNLRRYFGEGAEGRYLFLVDEAHNLVERAREMFSAVIVKEEFLALKRQLGEKERSLSRALSRCNKLLLAYKRECEKILLLADISELSRALAQLLGEMEELREEKPEVTGSEEWRSLYFSVRHFRNMEEKAGGDYRFYAGFTQEGQFYVRLFCVSPAARLQETLSRGLQTVFFSATLWPLPYYRELLGGREGDYAIEAASPFDRKKRLLVVCEDVSSSYRRRTQGQYQRIAEEIYAMCQAKEGHYLAFFPSYAFLQRVEVVLRSLFRGAEETLLIQESGMREEEKEAFLQTFCEENGSRLGLCVLGGAFSEGIDLKGEQLIGAAIVGTGLPLLCTERELIREYFDERGRDGYGYAYRIPGMNRVQQAAGRVIRTAEDVGVILLMDDRFLLEENQALFPGEWESYYRVGRGGLSKLLRSFWEEEAFL